MNSNALPAFWCHLCRKEFSTAPSKASEVECNFCRNTFCEMLESEGPHPSTFGRVVNPSTTSPNQNSSSRPPNRNNHRGLRTAMYFLSSGARNGVRTTANLIGSTGLSLDTASLLSNILGPALGLSQESNGSFQNLDQLLQYISEHDPKYSFYQNHQQIRSAASFKGGNGVFTQN